MTSYTLAHRARWATVVIFFLNGFGTSSWFVRIPALQDKSGVSDGVLGSALTCIAIGSLITVPLAGALISKFGSRAVVGCAVSLYAIILLVLAFNPTLIGLFIGMGFVGVATCSIDVAMNSQGVEIEKKYGRSLMSSFTAAFSVGGIAGSAAGGVLAGLGMGVVAHFLIVSSTLVVVSIPACIMMLPASVVTPRTGSLLARPSWPLFGLALIMFCIFLAEGAVGDWSAIYLDDSLNTGPGFAAFGFTAFVVMQAIGRLVGDRLMSRFSAALLVRVGAGVGAVGFGGSLLVANPYMGLVGFGALGLGTSLILPAVLSAAGRVENVAVGPALAAIGMGQYLGAFAGAPAIGFASDAVGLDRALFIVVAVLVALVLLASVVGSLGRAGSRTLVADATTEEESRGAH